MTNLPADFQLEYRTLADMTPEFITELVAFGNVMKMEERPDDPPTQPESVIAQFENMPDIVTFHSWVIRHAGELVGSAELSLVDMETNRHVAQANGGVRADFRRRGLGSALLEEVSRQAQAAGKTLLILNTNERVPAGGEFVQKCGLTPGAEMRISQLVLADVPAGLLETWSTRPDDGYTLHLWENSVPEAELADFIRMFGVMNSAPRENLKVEDFKMTAELWRQMEGMSKAAGKTMLVAVVRAPAGELVGLNDLSWRGEQPHLVQQGNTGVDPSHRGHGLGRWLKAANIRKLLERNPEAQFIRTGNANSNAPMLKINTEMGFKPYMATVTWQGEIADVLKQLKEE